MLVLTEGFDRSTLTTMLNGLAPFLGAQGMVFANRGTADVLAATEHLLTRTLLEWLSRNGHELGFDLCKSAKELAVEFRNWMVYLRGQQKRESDDYWQLTLSDLPFNARLGGMLRQTPHEPALSNSLNA